MFKPVDTFTIGWTANGSASSSSSSTHHHGSPNSHSNRSSMTSSMTSRLDPASMPAAAGSRRRDSTSIEGKTPTTPLRGSLMSAILAHDASIPSTSSPVQLSQRANFQAARSQVELSDPDTRRALNMTSTPATGALSARRNSSPNLLTKSNVVLSPDQDTKSIVELSKGRAMLHQSIGKTRDTASTSFTLMGGEQQASQASKPRAHIATNRHAHKGSFDFSSYGGVCKPDSTQPSPALHSRSTSLSSDIFFMDPSHPHHVDVPTSRRATAIGSKTSFDRPSNETTPSGSPSTSRIAPFAGRTNASTLVLGGDSLAQAAVLRLPSPALTPPSTTTTLSVTTPITSSSSPARNRASLIPQLRSKDGGFNSNLSLQLLHVSPIPSAIKSAAIAVADEDSAISHRPIHKRSSSMDGQSTQRRGTVNARNSSSLFDSNSIVAAVQPAQPTPQIPDVPVKFVGKTHCKQAYVCPPGQGGSGVQELLGW